MITFHGGPANGKTLQLKRAPLFLRVVVQGSKLDALDQLTDSPSPRELIYVYRRLREAGSVHIYFGGGKGGFYQIADYEFFPKQPHDSAARKTGAWQQWCRQQVAEALS